MNEIPEYKQAWFKYAIYSLNGDEKINGINPKLMKDIIENRSYLDEGHDGFKEFQEAIGPRRWEHIIESDLMMDSPDDRMQLKIIKLTLGKQIATFKLGAIQDPFSNNQNKLLGLVELAKELGWNDIL